MRAAVLTALNEPLEILEVEPCPLAYGQVLVRVLAAGICGAQLQEIRGEKGGPLPHLMGHEGVGLVESIGPGVKRVKPGDKVVMHWRKASGIESEFPKYRFTGGNGGNGEDPSVTSVTSCKNSGVFTSGMVTTWAEQTICSENRLTPVPDTTQDDLCVLLGCSLSTAIATVESETRGFGERVLVIGAGGLGLCLLQALALTAPASVTCCDLHESKRARVEADDDTYINLTKEKLTGEYDLILDTAGAITTTEAALERLAPSGKYVLIGQPPPKKPVCINAARHLFDGEGKTIKATQGGGFRPDLDIPRYLGVANRLFVHRLLTHVYPLDQINSALDALRAGEAGRIMIDMKPQALAKAA